MYGPARPRGRGAGDRAKEWAYLLQWCLSQASDASTQQDCPVEPAHHRPEGRRDVEPGAGNPTDGRRSLESESAYHAQVQPG